MKTTSLLRTLSIYSLAIFAVATASARPNQIKDIGTISQPSSEEDWTCGYAAKLGLTPDQLVFKKDHYPSLHKSVLQDPQYHVTRLKGAPNYRPSRASKGLYGTALPTIEGFSQFLNETQEHSLVWFNLREEVVLYFSGISYNLRSKAAPLKNLSVAKIDAAVLEYTEECIASKMKDSKFNIEFIDENPIDMKIIPVVVNRNEVQTPASVFKAVGDKLGYFRYVRVPMTDEKSADDNDLMEIANVIKEEKRLDPNVALAFNCHAGRGRTTQGMIVASLVANPYADFDELIELEGHLKNLKKDIDKASTPEERAEFMLRLQRLRALQWTLQ